MVDALAFQEGAAVMSTQNNFFDLLAPASPPVPSSDGSVESRHAAAAANLPSGVVAAAIVAEADGSAAGIASGPSESIHWLHVGPKRARTGCGIVASEYIYAERAAIAEESGDRFSCTLDCFSGTVTCQACKDFFA
jgi:hypothetical protein